jgi:hypothetical protein
MLFEGTPASTAGMAQPRGVDGIGNQQVLEFLRLVAELKQVAKLLAIEPARPRSSRRPRAKRSTSA